MRAGKSITETARELGIDRTYLSRLENGHERSSNLLLNQLISHLSLSEEEAIELSYLAGYRGESLVVGKEVKSVAPDVVKGENSTQVQVNVSDKTPILYTDSVFLTSNQYGLVFNVAQNMGQNNQQVVVARVGMSREHAKALLEVLGKHLAITTKGGKKQ